VKATLRLAVALAVAAGITRPTTAQETSIFRASIESVSVDVSVQQRGRPVTDLTMADFELQDAGVRQQLIEVGRETLPIDVTFVIDLSGSVQGPLLASLTRAIEATGRRLRPADRSSVITFNHRIRELRPLTEGGLPTPLALGTPTGQTSLLDALAVAFITTPESGRRRLTIVFTDGLDTTSFLDGATVVDLAKRAQAAVFTVALTAGSGRYPQPPAHEALFEQLAAISGGTLDVLQRDEDLSASFAKAFDDFRTSYVLRYTYEGPARPGWHDLAVRVTRRGTYDVRARQGYFSTGR
jgi:Ca-activated chloride channel family protein